MDPVRRIWTLRYTEDSMEAACRQASALRQSGLRVRVLPHTQKLLSVKPAINNATRTWREEQAEAQIVKADANKRYKSPG